MTGTENNYLLTISPGLILLLLYDAIDSNRRNEGSYVVRPFSKSTLSVFNSVCMRILCGIIFVKRQL